MFLCFLFVILASAGIYGQEGENEVAFSVGLTHHQTVAPGQKVVFDHVFTNQGNGLDTSTGVFTCPQAGVYVFQLHSLARNSSEMWLELFHNSDYVFSIYGHTDNDFSAAGNSVVLTLAKGDLVYVASVTDYAASELYGTPTTIYVTFSGYLISPVFQEFTGTGR